MPAVIDDVVEEDLFLPTPKVLAAPMPRRVDHAAICQGRGARRLASRNVRLEKLKGSFIPGGSKPALARKSVCAVAVAAAIALLVLVLVLAPFAAAVVEEE